MPIEAVTTRKIDEADSTKQRSSLEEDFKEVVFLVKNGKAVMQMVKTGIQDDRFIEIVEGLNEGDIIAIGPYTTVQQLLDDGDKVEAKERKEEKK